MEVFAKSKAWNEIFPGLVEPLDSLCPRNMRGKQPGSIFLSPPLTDVGEKEIRAIKKTKRIENQRRLHQKLISSIGRLLEWTSLGEIHSCV